jgi:hypothetical protein
MGTASSFPERVNEIKTKKATHKTFMAELLPIQLLKVSNKFQEKVLKNYKPIWGGLKQFYFNLKSKFSTQIAYFIKFAA